MRLFQIILIFLCSISIFSCNNQSSTSAQEILNAFRTEEAKAVEKYLDKTLVVDVPVEIMIPDRDGGIIILYTDHKSEFSVQFKIPKKNLDSAKLLKTYTVARISGICADGGRSRDILFKDCVVLQ